MQVAMVENDVLTSGIQQQTAFRVELNAMAFNILLDNIYSDKITTPIRELATNARDAHAVAGNLNRPFDIHLPSQFEPEFWVRDYGCSMDHDTVMGLYTTLFDSNKRSSNEVTGEKGLGSKSPFAYTTSFTVTCYLDHQERVYSCFMNEHGIPQVALMYEGTTTEENGVKVAFAVKSIDMATFRVKAIDALEGFDPLPNILNEGFEIPKWNVLVEGTGWKFIETSKGYNHRVRQGGVLYPLNYNKISDYTIRHGRGLVIDFPIGELQTTAGRESLSYDEATEANVQKRLAIVSGEFESKIQEAIKAAPTFAEACVLLSKVSRQVSLGSMKFLWNDIPVKSGEPDINDIGMLLTEPPTAYRVTGRSKTRPWDELEQALLLVEPEGTKRGAARIREMSIDYHSRLVIWVRGKVPEHVASCEQIDISKVELPKIQRTRGVNRPRKGMSLDGIDLCGRYFRDTFVPDGSELWLHAVNKDEIRWDTRTSSLREAVNIVDELQRLGAIPSSVRICFLREKVAHRVEKPTMLVDVARKKLPAILKSYKFLRRGYGELTNAQRLVKELSKHTGLSRDLNKFLKSMEPWDRVASSTTERAARVLGFDPQQEDFIGPDHLFEQMPLLRTVLSYQPDQLAYYLKLCKKVR